MDLKLCVYESMPDKWILCQKWESDFNGCAEVWVAVPKFILPPATNPETVSPEGTDFLMNRQWVRISPDKWAHPDRGCFFTLAEALKIERDNPATVSLSFVPQKWVNDYAIEQEPRGEKTWKIPTSDFLRDFPDQDTWEADHEKRDSMRHHPNAPRWVKEWEGPFEVELDDPHSTPWNPATV